MVLPPRPQTILLRRNLPHEFTHSIVVAVPHIAMPMQNTPTASTSAPRPRSLALPRHPAWPTSPWGPSRKFGRPGTRVSTERNKAAGRKSSAGSPGPSSNATSPFKCPGPKSSVWSSWFLAPERLDLGFTHQFLLQYGASNKRTQLFQSLSTQASVGK